MGPMRVTEEEREGLLHYLRGGTFLWVAAEAVGLRPEEVQEWVAVGSQTGAAEPYQSLAREVRQAMAQARAEAEMAMLKRSPGQWLKYGPGTETWGGPRWQFEKRAAREEAAAAGVVAAVLEALEGFPEARAAVEAALRGGENETRPPGEVPAATVGGRAEARGGSGNGAGSAQVCVMNVPELGGFGAGDEVDPLGVNDYLKNICVGGSPGRGAAGGGAGEKTGRDGGTRPKG